MKTNLDKAANTPMAVCVICAAFLVVTVGGPVGGALATVVCLSIPLIERVLERLEAEDGASSSQE